MAIIPWDKKYRETLSGMLERFRRENPQYQQSRITYAGRLDPLAEGLVILLTDADVHKKTAFLGLDKVYQVEFILGFETDSYDILGIVNNVNPIPINNTNIHEGISSLKTLTQQQYPPYSSKPVDGKPLWQWSKEGSDTSQYAPWQDIQIKTARYISSQEISLDDFNNNYLQTLTNVEGDFRQQLILNRWNDVVAGISEKKITIYCAEFHVSSGTYIRSLIHQLGQHLHTSATCVKITRTQVGDYHRDSEILT